MHRIRNEITIAAYLAGHPHVVNLQDVFETPMHIFLVQELCAGGTIRDVIHAEAPMNERRAATIFRQMIKAVMHCHQVDICISMGPGTIRVNEHFN